MVIKAAEAIAAKLSKAGSEGGLQSVSRVLRFKPYSANWLEEGASRWSEFTYERYEQLLRLHIWPDATFKRPLDVIQRRHIKVFLKKVARKWSPATVEGVHAVISGVFNEAIDDELVGANPASGLLKTILPPKSRRNLTDPDPFTVQERDEFLETAEATCNRQEAMLLKVMAFAGLRLGEVLAMRREHLSESRQTYYVAQSYKRGRYGRPKSGKMRLVDLPGFLVADLLAYQSYLKKERLRAGQGGRIDILFPDPAERWRQPISQRKVQGLVKRVCKAAGLRPRSPHDLRHTYASILLMAHESPGYVQRQMGHSSISITMDIYCHWIAGEGRQNLENALSEGGKSTTKVVRKSHKIAQIRKRPQ